MHDVISRHGRSARHPTVAEPSDTCPMRGLAVLAAVLVAVLLLA
jgi:hypothetical protein